MPEYASEFDRYKAQKDEIVAKQAQKGREAAGIMTLDNALRMLKKRAEYTADSGTRITDCTCGSCPVCAFKTVELWIKAKKVNPEEIPSDRKIDKGIYTGRDEIFHNKCPYCSCGNVINDDPMTCGQCGKRFVPQFYDPELIEKARRAAKRLGRM